MLIKELIEKLKTFDENEEIFFYDEYRYRSIGDVKQVIVDVEKMWEDEDGKQTKRIIGVN